jgi:hypothetical protein
MTTPQGIVRLVIEGCLLALLTVIPVSGPAQRSPAAAGAAKAIALARPAEKPKARQQAERTGPEVSGTYDDPITLA